MDKGLKSRAIISHFQLVVFLVGGEGGQIKGWNPKVRISAHSDKSWIVHEFRVYCVFPI